MYLALSETFSIYQKLQNYNYTKYIYPFNAEHCCAAAAQAMETLFEPILLYEPCGNCELTSNVVLPQTEK